MLGPLLIQDYKKIKDAEAKFRTLVANRKSKAPIALWIKERYEKELDGAKKQEIVNEAIALQLVPVGTTTDLFLKELVANAAPEAPPESLQRLQDLKNVMATKHGYN